MSVKRWNALSKKGFFPNICASQATQGARNRRSVRGDCAVGRTAYSPGHFDEGRGGAARMPQATVSLVASGSRANGQQDELCRKGASTC